MKRKLYLFVWVVLSLLLTSCYKEEKYVSKRDKTEVVEVDATKINPEKSKEIKKYVTSQVVNLRSNATVSSAVVSTLKKDTPVEVIEEKEEDGVKWSRVIVENNAGYIQSQYLIEK